MKATCRNGGQKKNFKLLSKSKISACWLQEALVNLNVFTEVLNENVWLIFKFLPQSYYENIKLIIVKSMISSTPFI